MKNYSRQREEIIKVIKSSFNHPTAEEVYMTVKSTDPLVSRSTVYRNLGMLVENQVINQISIKNGPDRYDYKNENHNHAICVNCGKVFDFEYEFDYEKLVETVKKQTGIEISTSGIALEGICDSCKK